MDPDSSPFRPGTLTDRVVLITGGGTGIGLAIAQEVTALGARVALCGRRLEPVTEAAKSLCDKGFDAIAGSVDIRQPETIEAFLDAVMARWGRIDVLVNNAGGQFPAPAKLISPKGFEAVVRNNLLGTFNMTHAVANRAMLPQRRGRVINVTANVSRGFPGMSHTGAARAGVENLTRSLAVEWARDGITVNAVAPGTIRSSGTDRYPQDLLEKAERVTPLGRLGSPQEVAHLVTFLALDASAYVTGSVFTLDGGATLWGDIWEYPEEG